MGEEATRELRIKYIKETSWTCEIITIVFFSTPRRKKKKKKKELSTQEHWIGEDPWNNGILQTQGSPKFLPNQKES